MNRFTPALVTVFALGLFSAAAVAADETAAPVAAASAKGVSAAQPSATPSMPKTRPAATTASRPADPVVRKMFCLNMAMQCFAMSQQASADGTKPAAKPASLDLRAPDIRRLVPEVELRERLPEPYEQEELQEQVQIEGMRPEVYVPRGLMTLPWAVMHPTQAWRIFLPVPSAK